MYVRAVQVLAGGHAGGWLLADGAQVAATGLDYTGIAALLASSAGVISAMAGAVSLLRTKKASEEDIKADVLIELLVKALEDERREDEERRNASRP